MIFKSEHLEKAKKTSLRVKDFVQNDRGSSKWIILHEEMITINFIAKIDDNAKQNAANVDFSRMFEWKLIGRIHTTCDILLIITK